MSELVDKIKRDIDTLAAHRGCAFQSDFDAVGDFHSKFGLPVSGNGREPRELTSEEVEFRFKFLAEELKETGEALGLDVSILWTPNGKPQDVPKAFDGLLDLVYVALGTAHMGGWPWRQGFAEVQRANMSKVRATSAEQSTRGSTLDVVKPEGFKPPNIIEVLMRAGWRGPRLRPFFDEQGHIPGSGQVKPLHEILVLDRPIVVFDLETTGTHKDTDRIVQIGVVKIYPDGTLGEWRTLVNPGMKIPAEVTAIHGITDEMVKDAPSFAGVAKTLLAGFDGCDLVAFNGRGVDMPFLSAEFKRVGIPWETPEFIDPYRIYQKFNPKTLRDLYREATGEEMADAHDALADVKGTIVVLCWLLEQNPLIPRTPSAILQLMATPAPGKLDAEGKFAWRGDDAIVDFGNRWAGTPLKTAKFNEKFRDYLRWIIRSEFRQDAKQICRDALAGKFPIKSATMEDGNGEEDESRAEVDDRDRNDVAGTGDGAVPVRGSTGAGDEGSPTDAPVVGQLGLYDRDEPR